jgi:protein phosphatase
VGAAGEQRNRAALPGLQFPDDVGPQDDAALPGGPQVRGSLAARGSRGALAGTGTEAGLVGEAAAVGLLPVEDDEPEPAVATGPSAAPGDERGFVRRHRGWFALGAVAVAGLLIGLAGFVWWLSSQWFVGNQAGYVAVSQGVPQTLAGIPLSRVTSRTALEVATLPYYDQQQVQSTIEAATEAEAQRIVTDLEAKAAACSTVPAPLGCPAPVPDGTTGTGSTTASPTATPSASPSRAP